MTNPYGYTSKAWEEIERKAAEQRAEQLRAQEEEKARNHRAWLRLCGMMAPIGGLAE